MEGTDGLVDHLHVEGWDGMGHLRPAKLHRRRVVIAGVFLSKFLHDGRGKAQGRVVD